MRRLAVLAGLLAVAVVSAGASGPLGVYGVIERVVFEPNEPAAERVQVWGAFAYADGLGANAANTSNVARGYLYFRLAGPDEGTRDPGYRDNVKREWADLKSVAGTSQAVAFGRWDYIAAFSSLHPDRAPTRPAVILHRVPRGGATTNLRVRTAGETPTDPAVYETNIGVVKLPDSGSHAAIVKELRDAIGRR